MPAFLCPHKFHGGAIAPNRSIAINWPFADTVWRQGGYWGVLAGWVQLKRLKPDVNCLAEVQTMARSRFWIGLLMVVALVIWTSGCGPKKPEPASLKGQVTVSAAMSLKEALEETKAAYQKQHPQEQIILNFGSSGALQTQIEQGAPVDIFISAAAKQMDELEKKGLLVSGSRRDWVQNQVVLVVPAGSRSPIKSFDDLKGATRSPLRICIGDPASVPAGQYAQKVLEHLGIWESLRPKLILAKDVRQVLTYVETHEVDAGIVYRTDALSSSKVQVVAEAPAGSHPPVVYPAALISGGPGRSAAQEFFDFLWSQEAVDILKKHGFTPVTTAKS